MVIRLLGHLSRRKIFIKDTSASFFLENGAEVFLQLAKVLDVIIENLSLEIVKRKVYKQIEKNSSVAKYS